MMPRYVAFLRAINVGGHTVKMDRLRAHFEELRLANVETFIASGNVLFDTTTKDITALETRIERHLETALGYDVATFIRRLDSLKTTLARQPFGDYEANGKTVWVGFLKDDVPPSAAAAYSALSRGSDELRAAGSEAWWLRVVRMSDPKLTMKLLQKALGGPVTFRSLTTIARLAEKKTTD
jgi:uncharacterized protein (DUF1697 family)